MLAPRSVAAAAPPIATAFPLPDRNPRPASRPGIALSGATPPGAAVERPLWQLIVDRLPARDPETEWYTIAEIAPLVGLRPRSLTKHARDLWPAWDGHYRLNYSQAVSLIRRVAYAGRRLPSRAELEAGTPGGAK